MARRSRQFKAWVGIGVVAAIVALAIWQTRRGPQVPAYTLVEAPLVQSVVASGRVLANVRSRVGSEVAGTVRVRHVDEGDRVATGDVLIELDDGPALARVAEARAALAQLADGQRPQARSTLRQAEIEATQAEREARRRQSLQAAGAFSREEVEQAAQARDAARARLAQARVQADTLAPGQAEERLLLARLAQAEADLARTTLRASFDGVVVSQDAEPGDVVQPGQILFDLAREGATEILLPVDEKNLARLALDQPAVVLADAYPDRPFSARVTRIAPGVDTQRGTIDVRLEPTELPDFLRQDMTVSVTIETARLDRALALPNDTLAARAGEPASVLLVRDGRAQRVPVQLGLRGLTMTQVRSGLAPGDVVLARPELAADTRVRPVLQPLPAALRPQSDD